MINYKVNKYYKFIIIVAAIILLHYLGALHPAESFLVDKARPVFSRLYYIGSYLKNIYAKQSDKRDLNNLVSQLEARVNFLTAENSKLKVLEEENKLLRSHLNFLTDKNYSYLMASAIYSGDLNKTEENKSNIVINIGENEGSEIGLAVLNKEGIVVGKVISINDHLSEVCLVTSKGCKFAASFQGKEGTAGIAEGDLGLTIKMQFIPQTENIKAGDIVVTSGLEKNIPRGLVIGKVSQVNKENNELWQNAVIDRLYGDNDLFIISVIKP